MKPGNYALICIYMYINIQTQESFCQWLIFHRKKCKVVRLEMSYVNKKSVPVHLFQDMIFLFNVE